MKTLENKFNVCSLPNFVTTRGTFDARSTAFIKKFDIFSICTTNRLTVPDDKCSKDCSISWGDMTGKTDHHFRRKFMDLNEDKACQYTLSFILNDELWEKLYSIIGTTLMDFILMKSIILRASPADEVYFVINRDNDNLYQELNTSNSQKMNPAQTVPSNSFSESQAKSSNCPPSLNSKKNNANQSGKTLPVHKNSSTDYLSFNSALYSRSNSLFWPKKNPIVSNTVDEMLESILNEKDCGNTEYLKIQADKSKLSALKTVITHLAILHRTKLYDKIVRKFHVFSEKKSATKIRLEKRRRKALNKKVKPFPSQRVAEKFLKKKLKSVKPILKSTVLLILSKLIRKLFYALLCGSETNFSILKKRLSKFLNFGKGQSVSVEFFINGIRLSSIKWLQEFTGVSTKKFLFRKVFAWFFKHYILTFLKTYFYITETGKSKNSILFFDKISWFSMKKVYLAYLSRSQKFRRMSRKDEIEFSRSAAIKSFGHFRFIPKSKGVRPLTLLRYSDDEKKIMNRYKTVLQQLLHNLNQSTPRSEILESLNTYYKKLKSDKANLFFVKVDVFDAFGSILQDKLIDIIEKGLASLRLSKRLSLHTVHNISYNRAQNKFCPGKKIRYSINLSRVKAPRNSINIFSRKDIQIDVPAMMSFLKKFIKSQAFREGPHLFHQVIGVPQSNPLSSVFSDLYYNDLTGQHLKRFTGDNNLLFRYTDDFIFITPNQKEAEDFYNTVSTGFPDYNCFFAKEKLETNLPQSPNPVSKLNFFGFSIDVCSSAVMVDYSSFNKTNIFSSISLLEDRNVSKVVEYHFRNLQICANSFHKVTLSYRFNSLDTTALNFFEAALQVATKLRILVSTLFQDCNSTRYLLQVVLDIVSKFENHNEALKKYRRFTLSQNFIKAITIDGFLTCFRSNPSWCEVSLELDRIRQEIHSSLPRNEQQRLHKTLNSSVSSNEPNSSLISSSQEY